MSQVISNSKIMSHEAIQLLADLISIKSFSKHEEKAADFLFRYFLSQGLSPERFINNVWVKSQSFDETKPTILLNSHIDTVRPAASYSLDPFNPIVKDGKLYGLGSNDAGGALVCLIQTFLYFNGQINLPFNLILAASAEEEISGKNGIASILSNLGEIDLGIVGEPTLMNLAIAEKGLVVLDCIARGRSGHAARDEGENAIYKALTEIEKLKSFEFSKVSALLGPIRKTVSMIEAGTQHNVVPDSCEFVVDVRTTDAYSNEETVKIISELLDVEVKPRSLRLKPSGLPESHPLVRRGAALGMKRYGSPTLSDQALMPFDTVKIGPGNSARSHTADEFIGLEEIEMGIGGYISLLENLKI